MARQGLLEITCTATNSLGSVELEHTIVIECKYLYEFTIIYSCLLLYADEPSQLILNVPKTVNREELSVDCSTDAANPAKHLTWRINGVKVTEGVEASEIVMETGGIISHSVINVNLTADVDQLRVTCCVDGMDLCSSKTATILGKQSYNKLGIII